MDRHPPAWYLADPCPPSPPPPDSSPPTTTPASAPRRSPPCSRPTPATSPATATTAATAAASRLRDSSRPTATSSLSSTAPPPTRWCWPSCRGAPRHPLPLAAHVDTDECGAPEFFSDGSKVAPHRGARRQGDPRRRPPPGGEALRHPLPQAQCVTFTQPPSGEPLHAGRGAGPRRHRRDSGWRCTWTAPASRTPWPPLGLTPADITWRAGVDVLCFGGTKNGLRGDEAVVLLQPLDVAGIRLPVPSSPASSPQKCALPGGRRWACCATAPGCATGRTPTGRRRRARPASLRRPSPPRRHAGATASSSACRSRCRPTPLRPRSRFYDSCAAPLPPDDPRLGHLQQAVSAFTADLRKSPRPPVH